MIDEVLARLEGVKRNGTGWVARCPAHEDRHQSLSVADGDRGVVLFCHAGCEVSDVVSRLGMKMSELFRDTPGSNVSRFEPEAIYPYVDEEGKLLFEVVRFPGKQFRQRQADGTWGVRGVRRVPYRLPEVLKAERVYVVEGEKDAEAIRKAGGTATCNMGGAGNWREEFAQHFAGKDVVIVRDMDEPGRKHAERVAETLEGVARSVEIVEPRDGKDAADHLQAGWTLGDFRSDDAGVATIFDLLNDFQEEMRNPPDLNEIGVPAAYSFLGPLMPGRLYILAGYQGEGKTASAVDFIRSAAGAEKNVGVVSLEMSREDLRDRIISSHGVPYGQVQRRTFDQMGRIKAEAALRDLARWRLDVVDDAELTVAQMEALAKKRRWDIMVVDHLHQMRFEDRREIEQIVRDFVSVAKRLKIPILLLAQLRRPDRADRPAHRPSMSMLRESGMIEALAAMVMFVYRKRSDWDGLRGDKTEFIVAKNRFGPESLHYLVFDPDYVRFSETQIPAYEEAA